MPKLEVNQRLQQSLEDLEEHKETEQAPASHPTIIVVGPGLLAGIKIVWARALGLR